MSEEQDRQDEDLQKKTNQVDPTDKIQDDPGLEDEINAASENIDQLNNYADEKDWVNAAEIAGELQEQVNRIYEYLQGKSE